jgi:hypothetical protein
LQNKVLGTTQRLKATKKKDKYVSEENKKYFKILIGNLNKSENFGH